ncbi:LysR substrate-binding domain-containing protein [Oceanimonas pelagia]|uniref:LysR substrate-binding domain-containing protein n=1 Tax=Oceanimonas pelagia TaxID=3028314 RepID=A0AA50KQ48_9GAMM|nr:LysR substrate-binding domain-containing protein [Oceanimonas pelagia]WMC11654.1 LysR substrate-binding domain-containing protein [Oceanimonas pelagia]
MKTPLPPLRALIAFEAAVRHGSFKLAANELNISPGAVSQQIRKLEDWLGFTLFVRDIRQVTVTEPGLEYYGRIAPPLAQIRQASEACRKHHDHSVCLSLTPALAARWLGPRIADFIEVHPGIDLRINSVSHPVDFERESVDLAIRHFDGRNPHLEVHLLQQDEVMALCSPEYRDRLGLSEPDDIAGAVLLHIAPYVQWDEWLDRFTALGKMARQRIRALYFDQSLLAIDAAKRGQGMVLSNGLLAAEEIGSGELINPFGCSLCTCKGYYLVHPKRSPLSPEANLLKQWLIKQFEQLPNSFR